MKTKLFKKSLLSLVLLIFVLVLMQSPFIIYSYDKSSDLADLYSITTDNEEWIQFESTEEMFKATQISMDVLDNLSTKDLFSLALEHPLACCIFAYDNVDDAIKFLSEGSNVFKALNDRNDKSTVLVNTLKSLSTKNNKIVSYDLNQKNENESLKNMLATFLLSSSTYSNGLSQNDIETLDMLDKSNAIAPYALYASPTNTTVTTPKGSTVIVTINGEQLSAQEVRWINNSIDSAYPLANRLRSATTHYNCHSYAWYSTSSTNKYWMDYPTRYMTDGSYRFVARPSAGDKVYYYNGNHSGIVKEIYNGLSNYSDYRDLITLTSKWGTAGLYTHLAMYSPYTNGIKSYTR